MVIDVGCGPGCYESFALNRPDDPNHHLCTCTPLRIRNLLGEAGLVVRETPCRHARLAPGFSTNAAPFFHALCWLTGTLNNR